MSGGLANLELHNTNMTKNIVEMSLPGVNVVNGLIKCLDCLKNTVNLIANNTGKHTIARQEVKKRPKRLKRPKTPKPQNPKHHKSDYSLKRFIH